MAMNKSTYRAIRGVGGNGGELRAVRRRTTNVTIRLTTKVTIRNTNHIAARGFDQSNKLQLMILCKSKKADPMVNTVVLATRVGPSGRKANNNADTAQAINTAAMN